jgi:hypothetical protein
MRRTGDERRRSQIRRNNFCNGNPLANETTTRRTDTRTAAPIFNSFRRIVSQRARAIDVPANPSRRNAETNTYPSDDSHSRI